MLQKLAIYFVLYAQSSAYYSSMPAVLRARSSYAKREKRSGQKDRTKASDYNAITGNSGVHKIETNQLPLPYRVHRLSGHT